MDRELAAALAGELPAAANIRVSDAIAPTLTCPVGTAGARYDLPDGRLTFIIAAPDVILPTWTLPSGSVRATSTASRGQRVVVVSEPYAPGEPAPYADQVQRIATDLAGLY